MSSSLSSSLSSSSSCELSDHDENPREHVPLLGDRRADFHPQPAHTFVSTTGSDRGDDDTDERNKLGPFMATALAGNDILSSCLYASGLVCAVAGRWAPLCLLLVALVLYLFRAIYAEVGSALPYNGGTYNLLLNVSPSKRTAAAAGALTLLSYIATALISATTAMFYLRESLPRINVYWGTVAVLVFFAALALLGIRESARWSAVVFTLHLCTLVIFLVGASKWIWKADFAQIKRNMSGWDGEDPAKAIFFGFSVGLLGITGFETSTNYIEEQKRDTFPVTLRNLWLLVTFFNPLICFVSLGVMSVDDIKATQEFFLSSVAMRSQGNWLRMVVNIDAVCVLCGTVVTCYIGAQGVARRMAMDHALPGFLMNNNSWRKTPHWIIFGFMSACLALHMVVKNDIVAIGGVYTVAFVSVMALFAWGNLMLKTRRNFLPRRARAGWGSVVLALSIVLIGLTGYAVQHPRAVMIALLYFSASMAVVLLTMYSVSSLRFFVRVLEALDPILSYCCCCGLHTTLLNAVRRKIERTVSQGVVFFMGPAHANLHDITKVCQYVIENEEARHLRLVHLMPQPSSSMVGAGKDLHSGSSRAQIIPMPDDFEKDTLNVLRKLFPQLTIVLVAERSAFGGALVRHLSERWQIPINFMFVGSPRIHDSMSEPSAHIGYKGKVGPLRIIF